MALITRAVTFITGVVTLVTRSDMCKNGGEVPGEGALGASWRQGG